MPTGPTPRGRVQHAIAAVLPSELRVSLEPVPQSTGGVFDVTVKAGSTAHRFVAGWAGKGWPVDVDGLLSRAPKLDVVVARRLSDGARAKLADRRIGWVDETGQANVVLRSGLVVVRETAGEDLAETVNDRWNQSMLTVAEAILSGVAPTVEAIEAASELSRGASANALKRFEDRGRIGRPGPKRGLRSGRQILDLDAFIDDYVIATADFRRKQRVRRLHRLMADPLYVLEDEMGPVLRSIGATWAVTGAAASILLAPYLSEVGVLELYVDADHFNGPDLPRYLESREVAKGHVIELRELPTPMSVRGPEINGVQVALPARVYADLNAAGGRFAEAGQHLREVRGVGPGAK
jgi:hypothetical protein